MRIRNKVFTLAAFISLILTNNPLFAETTETEDYYTKGFNDAYSRGLYETDYDLHKVYKKIRLHQQRNTLSKADLELLDAAAEYNEGYTCGMYEKFGPKKKEKDITSDPISNIEGDYSYSLVTTPQRTIPHVIIEKTSTTNPAEAAQMLVVPQ